MMFFVAVLLFTAFLAQAAILPETEGTEYSQALLQQINLYRLEKGLNQLRHDPILTQLANTHSTEMFRKKTMDHRNFEDRFKRSNSRLCVENVGWNYGSPLKMFDGWHHSTLHNQNMLQEGVSRAGIAEIGEYVTFFACK